MARRAAFFVYVWPEPRSSAAGVRTYALFRALLAAGWEVAAVSPSGDSPHRAALEALGVRTHTADPNRSAEAEAALGAGMPELVVYDRFVMEEQFGWRARAAWPNALHVVDTQDLHSLRRAREKQKGAWEEMAAPAELGPDFLRELASLHRADAALVVSRFEQEFLAAHGYTAACLPFPAARAAAPTPLAAREGFCFLGNFRHPPNLDSARWLVEELWPAVRARLPAATLHFYGAYPPAEVSRWRGEHGLFAHGPVEDHRAALSRHTALLAPLRFGAGIKGKVLEAWGTGTPVIGSPITFEGMGEAGLVARDAASFSAACARVVEEPAVAEECRAAGFSRIEADFREDALAARFLTWIEEERAGLDEKRARNLVGQMLRLQENNSTKYFSRWIEAKNREL